MQKPTLTGHAPVNGIKMYYEVYGQGGTPLVLIHGGGSTIQSSFGNLLPLLMPHRQVIALELQAHGRTTDRDAPESFEQDATDVAALLKYLKVHSADLLGFSNGGTTAMRVSIAYPQLVNRLIVISGMYKRDGIPSGFWDGMQHATLSNMPTSLQAAYLAVNPDKAGLQNMFNKDKQRMLNFKDWSDDDLRAIKAATLVINSDKDVVLPGHALRIAELIPKSHLVILPGVHGGCIGTAESDGNSDLPQVTAKIITLFLKGGFD